jgi:hypothetical protein
MGAHFRELSFRAPGWQYYHRQVTPRTRDGLQRFLKAFDDFLQSSISTAW